MGLSVDEQHAQDVSEHEEHHEDGNHVDEHMLVLPRAAVCDASRSAGIAGTYFAAQASASLRRVSSRCSGTTLMSASTGMKFVSPCQRGTIWKCT